ncbi:TrmH family RNA methyltransferase [Candidatus Saccharibacteria bacterium]|nr:TrmH family RNA methyltransferase [Candidatus Saccharibacteria bacterium]
MEIILILDNIRSCYNVGAILRTAEGFGVSHVILSGYTPRVHDGSLLPHLREKLDREIHKTALGAEDILDIRSCDDILSEVEILRKQGWQVVGLENNIETEKIVSLSDKKFAERLSDKVVLVLGEEVHGISEEMRERIELFLEIPMRGQKESFNVSVAAGIALFALVFGE